MTFLYHTPTWLLFAALAFPLACVAWTARRVAIDTATQADDQPKTVSAGPITYQEDGTRSQTITVKIPLSHSSHFTIEFGPLSISANARKWAANAVLLGLLLTLIGLIGLLHFPTHGALEGQVQLLQGTAEPTNNDSLPLNRNGAPMAPP